MRVLVTGALGFIGSHVIEALYDHPIVKYVVGIDKADPKTRSPVAADVIRADINTIDIREILRSHGVKHGHVDYVYHFASPCSVIEFKNNPNLIIDSFKGYNNIIRYCVFEQSSLIYPSTGNIYGNVETPFWEKPVRSYLKPNNLYAISKHHAECMALVSHINSIGFRIFAGYGPGEQYKGKLASVITHFLRSMMHNQRPVVWGDGKQTRDFIYIDDIVDVMLEVINPAIPLKDRFKYKIVNLGTGISHSFNEVVDVINKVLGTNIKATYMNKPSNYVQSTQANTWRMKEILFRNTTTLEDGIRKYVEVLKSEETQSSNG